ncbi:hypothetical protein SLS60_011208 [Paraconiothyrium brasiliense]|uniref:RING-type domain-containing protein n=1 Tax=Paraconiothyrium brasiliense TaxID=300254 RepID=A0ABR3QKW3_9PLEO
MPHPSIDVTGYYQTDYVHAVTVRVDLFKRGVITYTDYVRDEFSRNHLLDLRDERTTARPEDGDNCPICIESFDLTTKVGLGNVQVIAGCGHIFHRQCLWPWFEDPETPIVTCPMCRRELFPNPKYTGDWSDHPGLWAGLVHVADKVARLITVLDSERALFESSGDAMSRLTEAGALAAQLRLLFLRYQQLIRQRNAPVTVSQDGVRDYSEGLDASIEVLEVHDKMCDLSLRIEAIVEEAIDEEDYGLEDEAPVTPTSPPAVVNAAIIAPINADLARVPDMPEDNETDIEAENYRIDNLVDQWSTLLDRFNHLLQEAKELHDRGEYVLQEMENEMDQVEVTLYQLQREIQLATYSGMLHL